MPSVLKTFQSIRRRSKQSLNNTAVAQSFSGDSSEISSSHDLTAAAQDTNGAKQQQQRQQRQQQQQHQSSSSTLSSAFDKTSPPTTLSSSQKSASSSHLPILNGHGKKTSPPPSSRETLHRPRLPSSSSNRYSLVVSEARRPPHARAMPTSRAASSPLTRSQGMPPQSADVGPRPTPATSPYAPRVLSVSDGSWVHQKVLLIFGTCANPDLPIDGSLTVFHHQDNFPATQWPVCDSHFKALVYLLPGPNRLRLDFVSPKLPAQNAPAHSSWININYLPLNSSPPLHLCILVAKDSAETFDAVPERVQKEGNGLATAVKKFRMAAYLWQAFTAEQMNRNGFGRRCYRYEEEWQPGTLTWRDAETAHMRNEAKIHIIRLNQTVGEIRHLDLAQQYEKATRKGDLFSIASDAVRSHFGPRPGQRQYVSCMFLDTHWDKKVGTVRGHAALGGGDNQIKLAIFGSHALQSYPTHIEEVVPAFTDCTRTNTDYVANDCNESGSNWEACNIGIGAHLHETGHLFGCPHQESGVMLRDYVRLNRTFTCREPYSTRTKQQGMRLCLPKDECGWHRLDALRFRFHPCFQLPMDQPYAGDSSVQVWTVDNGTVLITDATGVAWIELFPEGDDVCHHWIEYLDNSITPPNSPRHITLTDKDFKDLLPEDKRKKKLALTIFACGGAELHIDDFGRLTGKEGRIRSPDGRPAFRSSKLGFSSMEGSHPQELFLGSSRKAKKPLLSIRVYHGHALDGIEFVYEDGENDLFGKRGGRLGGTEFALDTRRGETIIGFYVRAGVWIDGLQILTSSGRKSEIFGNASGGSGHTLIPPRGYTIAGIYGSCGAWVDGFGLIISR